MDVIRRIFGRSFARARASNRAKDWPVPAQGVRFPSIARPRDAASPRGAEGERVKSRVVCKSERKLLDASVRLPWRPPSVREA